MRIRTLAVLGLVLAAAGGALAKSAKTPKLTPPSNGPVMKGLKIHEWGVFLPNGKETSVRGGGAPPTFVQRVSLPPAPEPEDRGLEEAVKEPVLHIYAPQPTDLEVRVFFPGGKPEIAWPRAQTGWAMSPCGEQSPFLLWSLRVGGEGEAQPPKIPDDHWIAAARKAGGDLLRTPDGKDAERFLFYEGEVPLTAQATAKVLGCGDPGIRYALSSKGPDETWFIGNDDEGKNLYRDHRTGLSPDGREVECVVDPASHIEKAVLRTELAKALASAGLAPAESDTLLGIWMPELVKPGKRLVYLLPRAEYDRLLPILFDPAPEELVRVGLVVQEIQP